MGLGDLTEYLDALRRLPRTVDVGTHVPHGAVRAYVLGDREQPGAVPTAEDIEKMSAIVEEGVRAGALGFWTSRTVLHRSVDGELVPGTTATAEELIAIGRAMGKVGYGVFELASDLRREWDEFGWMGALSRETGLPVTFAALQSIAKEQPLSQQIERMRAENDNGANIVAAIALRGNGIVMAWQGTVHPFRMRPSWQAIADLPWDQQRAKLLDPAFKAPGCCPKPTTTARFRPMHGRRHGDQRGLGHAVRNGRRFRLRTRRRRQHPGPRRGQGRDARRICI